VRLHQRQQLTILLSRVVVAEVNCVPVVVAQEDLEQQHPLR
jgi:hypothetical protein